MSRVAIDAASTGPSTPVIQQLISVLQKSLSDLSASLSQTDGAVKPDRSFTAVQAGYGALEAAMLPTQAVIMRTALEYHVSLALGVVVELGLPEVISSAGESGMSSSEIEKAIGVPWGKASRLLRLLSGRGVFREVRPDVWAHTHHSRGLDSGLSYDEIVKEPLARFSKGASLPAMVSQGCAFGLKAGVGIFPAFHDQKYLKSYKATEAPFNVAYETEKNMWNWMQTVDGGVRLRNYAHFMKSVEKHSDYSGYPWSKLGPDAVGVDVGGGLGSAATSILPHAPNISKFVIQDLEPVIQNATTIWKDQGPDNTASGVVEFQAHDFFTPQRVKGAQAYFLRRIVHDWSDEDCIIIFKHLHDAAADSSRLLIVDSIIEHACHDLGDAMDGAAPGAYADLELFPAPLPANGGKAAELELNLDLHMMCLFNGQERTYLQLRDMAAKAGWTLKQVYRLQSAHPDKLIEFVKN